MVILYPPSGFAPDGGLRGGRPHVVTHVSSCAAYIKPADASKSAESDAISITALVQVVQPIIVGETHIMPTLKQTEAAIEDFAMRELVKPVAKKLCDMHVAIQKSSIATEFNDDHGDDEVRPAVAAFANRMGDAVYDAVVSTLQAFEAQLRSEATVQQKAREAAAKGKPHPKIAKVAYGPGKAAAIAGAKIVSVDKTAATGPYAMTGDNRAHVISTDDYAKLAKLGLTARQPSKLSGVKAAKAKPVPASHVTQLKASLSSVKRSKAVKR